MKKHLLFSIYFALTCITTFSQGKILWGTAKKGGSQDNGVLFTVKPDGSGYQIRHNFEFPLSWSPSGKLLNASDGKIYGTCENGGDNSIGTIFSYDPATGIYSDDYSFYDVLGYDPICGLEEYNGSFYGITFLGGGNDEGTLYKYNPASHGYYILHDFDTLTGYRAMNIPILYNNKLYGTTNLGGANDQGVIYSYDLNTNIYTTYYDFTTFEGQNAEGGLVLASDGKMYGTTYSGGTWGAGTIFSFDPANNVHTTLWHLDYSAGGHWPVTKMIEVNSILYGVTGSQGTIFRFNPADTSYADLYDFDTTNGSVPEQGIASLNGSFYGTTSLGGTNNKGVVYGFNPSLNQVNVLVEFDGTNGSSPESKLLVADDVFTSLKEIDSKDQIKIYPNPCSNVLNIAAASPSSLKVIIFDATCREVLRQDFSSAASLATKTLSPGIYIYEINNGNDTQQRGQIIKVNE